MKGFKDREMQKLFENRRSRVLPQEFHRKARMKLLQLELSRQAG